MWEEELGVGAQESGGDQSADQSALSVSGSMSGLLTTQQEVLCVLQ